MGRTVSRLSFSDDGFRVRNSGSRSRTFGFLNGIMLTIWTAVNGEIRLVLIVNERKFASRAREAVRMVVSHLSFDLQV